MCSGNTAFAISVWVDIIVHTRPPHTQLQPAPTQQQTGSKNWRAGLSLTNGLLNQNICTHNADHASGPCVCLESVTMLYIYSSINALKVDT